VLPLDENLRTSRAFSQSEPDGQEATAALTTTPTTTGLARRLSAPFEDLRRRLSEFSWGPQKPA